jgi:hypothetical protein
MIADKKMKGIQLIVDKYFQSDFIKGYKITGIPIFILLGTQGNIVASDAPKPSDDIKIAKLFEGLEI